MTGHEKAVIDIMQRYGFMKVVKGYPFKCIVIPEPLLGFTAEQIVKYFVNQTVAYKWKKGLEQVTEVKP